MQTPRHHCPPTPNYQIKNLRFFLSQSWEENKLAVFLLSDFSPRKIISCGHKETIISEPRQEDKSIPTPEDPLSLVESEISALKYYSPLKDGRFSGGAVGYLSYEYANRIENTVPIPSKDDLELPLVYFMVTDLLLIFDHAHQSFSICANVSPGADPNLAYKSACDKIIETRNRLLAPLRCLLPHSKKLVNQAPRLATSPKRNL